MKLLLGLLGLIFGIVILTLGLVRSEEHTSEL